MGGTLWSQLEIDVLEEMQHCSIEDIHKVLPYRTMNAIKIKMARCMVNGFREYSGAWSPNDVQQLKDYSALPVSKISGILDIDGMRVRRKLSQLGIRPTLVKPRWSQVELNILKSAANMPMWKICLYFPNRSRKAVYAKLIRLKKEGVL